MLQLRLLLSVQLCSLQTQRMLNLLFSNLGLNLSFHNAVLIFQSLIKNLDGGLRIMPTCQLNHKPIVSYQQDIWQNALFQTAV